MVDRKVECCDEPPAEIPHLNDVRRALLPLLIRHPLATDSIALDTFARQQPQILKILVSTGWQVNRYRVCYLVTKLSYSLRNFVSAASSVGEVLLQRCRSLSRFLELCRRRIRSRCLAFEDIEEAHIRIIIQDPSDPQVHH